MAFHTIAVAGASGNLGVPVLRELLKSVDHIFEVVVLTRSSDRGTESFLSAAGLSSSRNKPSIVTVEYDDHSGLVRALTGVDVLIATLPGAVFMKLDPLLLSAAQEAGVRRFIPSQYTLDVLHPTAQALFLDGWPNAFPVMAARQYEALADTTSPTSYTCIVTSMFLDVFLAHGQFGAYDIRGQKASLVDDGAGFFTACSTDFIAAAIVAVLKMPEEATKNRRIPIAEVRTTGNELVKSIEEVFDIKMDVQHKNSDQFLKERRDALAAGDVRAAYARSVMKLASDGSGPGDLVDGLKFDAGGTLTFRRRTLRELVLGVRQVMQSI